MNMKIADNNGFTEKHIHGLLLQRNFVALINLCEKDRHLWRNLQATLFHPDDELRWPAIEAVAIIMHSRWQTGNKERVREYLRRLLWSMCDEAGEMGWSAPQTVAEIIYYIPELLDPYGSMMVSRILDEPALLAGGLWGIGRLGLQIKKAVESMTESILQTFQSQQTDILGVAAWAMGEANFSAALPYLENLRTRKEPLRIYINSSFHQKSLGQWAREAIAKIDQYHLSK